jgi:hypothetical protein
VSDAHEAILGPPWAVDFTLLAREAREGLPPHVQAMYDDVLFEIITARNPYVNDVALPMRSSRPLGRTTPSSTVRAVVRIHLRTPCRRSPDRRLRAVLAVGAAADARSRSAPNGLSRTAPDR